MTVSFISFIDSSRAGNTLNISGLADPFVVTIALGAGPGGPTSRRRDCHFAGALSPSLLIHLPKVEGGAAE